MIDDTHMIESLRDQVADYANRLTRAIRIIDRMHEVEVSPGVTMAAGIVGAALCRAEQERDAALAEVNRQAGSIHALHDMIQDCWDQFAVDVTVDGETWQSDGAMSTLEMVAYYLVKIGDLVQHPTRRVYRRRP